MDPRSTEPRRVRAAERGAALIIAMLVTIIMALLGVSFLLMAETENRIAENERLGAQALYAAEAGARQVKRWFDRPPNLASSASNVLNPPLAAIDRTLRRIDADGDPDTAAVVQDGSNAAPRYKQGVDLDGDGDDDVFDRPYRTSLVNTLLGTEDGPDMRIAESGGGSAATFLASLSDALLGGFPGSGLQARITQIDVYAPPYVELNATWVRHGMATVRVVARVYQTVGGVEQVLAERVVKAVFNETPYPGPFGPLHSCDDLSFNGDFTVHWGVASAVGDSDLTNNHAKLAASLPRDEPPGQRLDMLWGYDSASSSAAPFEDYVQRLYDADEVIEDPWFRYLSGGVLAGANPSTTTPFAFSWTIGQALGDGTWPNHEHGGEDGTHANLMHTMPIVSCPLFEYETWKEIATSGGSDVHYYTWSSGTSFKENGVGAAQTFEDITNNAEGLFFFDTTDGNPPIDSDADGEFENMTPEIVMQGGTWHFRGFLYLNTVTFQTKGVGGVDIDFAAPGEPWLDIDSDGRYDSGEPWVNLDYPDTIDGDFVADENDAVQDDGTVGMSAVRNSRGPTFQDETSMWGILFNNGYFEATGNARYYGSVIGRSGIAETSVAAGTPEFYWDQSIADNWPPPGWDLPRVVITRWETDL